jgi:hypothetical protein
MPKLRFIGDYTNGHTSIAMGDYVFEGRKPTMVDETTDMGRRLMGNPEFSADPLDHDGNGESGGSTAPEGDLSALRKEYEAAVGKRPFPGWDEATLRAKMEAAK